MVVTDLKLKVKELPAFVMPDRNLDLHVELHNKGKKIARNSFLKFVDFSLQHSIDGQTEAVPLRRKKSRDIKDKGIYLARIEAPLQEGRHELVINADARTFSRSRRISVEVAWPLEVDIEKTARPGVFKLWIKPRAEMINPTSLQLTAELETPDETRTPVELKPMNGQWLGELRADGADGLHRLWIDMKARDLEDRPVAVTLEPYPLIGVRAAVEEANPVPAEAAAKATESAAAEVAPDPEPATPDPVQTVEEPATAPDNSLLYIAIASFNLLLLAGGAGLWWWLRARKREKIQLLDEDDDDPEVAIDD